MPTSGPLFPTRLDPHPAQEGLTDPLPKPLERLLRLAAWEHAVGTRQRLPAPQIHVGAPGLPHPVIPATEATSPHAAAWFGEPDQALRTDAIAAMRTRAGCPHPLVWLVRTGERTPQDLDHAWLAAARHAYAEAGAPLVFVIVDRHGWWDPRSGIERTWRRLRKRSLPAESLIRGGREDAAC